MFVSKIKIPARITTPARQPDGSLGGGHSVAGGRFKLIATILGIALSTSMPIGSFSRAFASPVTADKLIELTNQARAESGLNTLLINSLLTDSAQGKSNDMLAKNYFAHTSPEGVTPWDWITGAGYDYIYAGENLAKNFATAEAMFAAWMNSPTHKANILSENYKEIGIAIATDGTSIYATQHFGTQKAGNTAGTTTTQSTPPATRSVTIASVPTDTTAPVIETVPVTNAAIEQGDSISFSLTIAGDPKTVTAKAGEKSVALTEQDGKWVGQLTLYAGGEYMVTMEAADAAGNTAVATLGTVTVSVPTVSRENPNTGTIIAAYWKDVVTNEAAPIAAALLTILIVSLGTIAYTVTVRRFTERLVGHALPALAKSGRVY